MAQLHKKIDDLEKLLIKKDHESKETQEQAKLYVSVGPMKSHISRLES